MKDFIVKNAQLLELLDRLLKEQSRFSWNHFYSDRKREIPFFVDKPDENLVTLITEKNIPPGKVLELGCGQGRNATYLANLGWKVDAVDSSSEAINWGRDRAETLNVKVNFIEENIFNLTISAEAYDLVYDSGCFHHIPPHRRESYRNLVVNALKPGGYFGLTCFVEGGEHGGTTISDFEIYRLLSLQGGLGYSEEKLQKVFSNLELIELRMMNPQSNTSNLFGVNGLMVGLFKKN